MLNFSPSQETACRTIEGERAVGLAEAAFASWNGSNLSTEDKKDRHQELEARLTDLAGHGMRGLLVDGRLVIASLVASSGPYDSSAITYGRGSGDKRESNPVELKELTVLYTTETFSPGSCCAVRKLSSNNDTHILCGSCCEEDSAYFCKVHREFLRTQPARVICQRCGKGCNSRLGTRSGG